MGRYLWLLLTGFAVAHTTVAQTFPVEGLKHNPVNRRAYIHARIIPQPGVRMEDATLYVEDGVIRAVGKNIALPKGTPVTDLRGAYIYPGFIDVISSYGMPEIPKRKPEPRRPRPTTTQKNAVAWNEAIHSERDAALLFQPDTKKAGELIKQGFTWVQTAQRDGIFQGRSAVVMLNEHRAHDNVVKEHHAQFLSFSKGRSRQDYPTSLMGAIALIRQTLYDARWYHRARQAWRRHPDQKKPEYNAALEALLPVIEKKEPLWFTVNNYLDVQRAARLAREFDLPVVIRGAPDLYKRIDDLKALDVPLVVPLNFPPAPYLGDAYAVENASLARLKYWDTAPETPARLAAAGISFALTSDGLSRDQKFLKQLRLAVQRGLSPETALDALTRMPARLLGLDKQTGTLEAGKRANFIIAGGDLFRDAHSVIHKVVIDGQVHDVAPLPDFDWRGVWRITGTDAAFDVHIQGKPGKPRVTVQKDSVRRKIAGADVAAGGLKLTLPAGMWAGHAPVLISLDRFGTRLEGFALDSGGRRHVLSGERVKGADNQAGQKKKSDAPTRKALFPVRFPDMAWGRETVYPQQPEYVLIKNATLWTAADRGILEDYDMLIRKGVIQKIARGIKAPRNAWVIDARGKHVTPGLIDEHSHIAISRGVNEAGQAISAEVRIGDVVNPDNINIYRQLAGGVTVSQLLHGSANPIGGQAQVIKLRWGANSEALKFKAAPPTIKFALGENVKQSNWGDAFHIRYPQTRMGVKELFIDAFERARAYEQAWKNYRALSARQRHNTVPPRRDLELDALTEILNSQRFIHCHSYVQSEILGLMEVAERFGFRIATFTHILEGYKVAPEMARHGAMGSTFADWWDYKFEVYEAIPYNTALMTRAGVVASVNSDDAEMARRLNHEAAKAMTYGGLTPEEAIRLVTINPARQLKVDERVGSLQTGKDADFVIWSGPPLSGYSMVEQTWIEGRRYFDVQEDIALRKTVREQRRRLIERALKQTEKSDKKPVASPMPDTPQDYRCDDLTDYIR